MKTAQMLGQLMMDRKTELSLNISRRLKETYTNFLINSNLENDAIVNWRAELIGYIGQALVSYKADAVWGEVTDWAIKTGEGAVQYGVAIDQLLSTNKLYRKVVWDFIKENLNTEMIKVNSFLEINDIIDTLLDHVAYTFSVSFVKYHKKMIEEAKERMMGVSTPVVSLTEQVAILPLVGEIDSDRALIILETTLQRCGELKVAELIIDLSGVPTIDVTVAHELFKVASALQLIGVKPIFTGMRAEIARTVVELGVVFKDIQVTGSLQQVFRNKSIERSLL